MSLPPVLIQDPPKRESSGGSSSGSPESEEWMAETERPFLPPQTPSKPGRVASGRSSALLSLSHSPPPTRSSILAEPAGHLWSQRGPHSGTVPRSVPWVLREEGSGPPLPSQHPPKEIEGLRPSPLAPGVKTKWRRGVMHTLAVELSQESLVAAVHSCPGLHGRELCNDVGWSFPGRRKQHLLRPWQSGYQTQMRE